MSRRKSRRLKVGDRVYAVNGRVEDKKDLGTVEEITPTCARPRGAVCGILWDDGAWDEVGPYGGPVHGILGARPVTP